MDTEQIDEGLYSRQLYVMGHEAQRRMAASDVLIAGVNGLGVEIAKNVILAGVRSVTLHDNEPATWVDLSAQFYLTEQDIGRPRAAACVNKLAELNPYVQVTLEEAELTEAVLRKYKVVLLVDASLDEQLRIGDFCHANNIQFITTSTHGLMGSVFCDFGDEFICYDTTGEPAAQSMVASIANGEKTLITCLEDTRHNLSTGDVVAFSAISGMEELNGVEAAVEVKDPWSFEIDINSVGFGKYTHGGYINEVKQPKKLSFKSLRETLEDPGMFVCDFMKFDTVPVLHLAWRTLHEYTKQHGALPEPGDQAAADRFAELAATVNSQSADTCKVELIDASTKILKNIARTARGVVSPICAVLGGIVGQEVLKACSGKFMPIVQWFHFDALEALPDEPLPAEAVQPVGSRYDGQIMVFGREIQEMLSRQTYFLVGAGAIGCEMLKNWAMMGVACGGGQVHVTDMDRIERSNLSRQFLFRIHDINHPKSVTAARAATEMNNAFRTIAYEQKVAPDTEHLFNDDFYESLDAVCTALDNVEARLYVDQRCLFYHLPLLESGTLGTKGNTQIVVPKLTENYGATRDPPEKGIPICTLKHFPNQIEHTLQWAREWFEETFKQTPEDVNRYLLSTREEFNASLANQQNMKMDVLKRIKDALTTNRPANFEDCVTWARLQFQATFVNNIKQLLHNYPLDKKTSSGTPFWSGAKKPPVPVEFDVDDPMHMEFVVSVASMRATVYGLNTPEDVEGVVRRHLPCVNVPVFVPQDGVKIATTDEEAKNENQPITGMDIDRQCTQLLDELPSPSSLAGFVLQAIDFDKDVDDHMHVVASCANLRAVNYRIPTADLHTARGIAGKIIPAIATTTAMVTGFICLEIYKLLQKKPLEAYRNFFANLALPIFTTSEPNPPVTTKAMVNGEEWKFSAWDRVDIADPDMTLEGLQAYMESQYRVELGMLSHGVSILFSSFMNAKKLRERKTMKIKDIVESVTKRTIPAEQKYLIFELIVNDTETGDEVEFPYLRFKLH